MRLLSPFNAKDSGFSLFEALVAFALVAGVLAFIYQSSFASMRGASSQVSVYETTEFARSQLDELVEMRFEGTATDIYASRWEWHATTTDVPPKTSTYLDADFTMRRTTIEVSDLANPNTSVTLSLDTLRKNR